MAASDTRTYHASIREGIARSAGTDAGAIATARATFALWQRMAAQLEPVIGARGVDALFGRALHLAARQYPWLAAPGIRGNSATALDHVQRRLATQTDVLASEAALGLLGAFTELLATLVGDSLTGRLLEPAWDPSPSNKQQEHAP